MWNFFYQNKLTNALFWSFCWHLLFGIIQQINNMDLLGSIMGKMEKRSKRPEPTKQQKDLIERNKKLVEREREKKKFMKKKIEVISIW